MLLSSSLHNLSVEVMEFCGKAIVREMYIAIFVTTSSQIRLWRLG